MSVFTQDCVFHILKYLDNDAIHTLSHTIKEIRLKTNKFKKLWKIYHKERLDEYLLNKAIKHIKLFASDKMYMVTCEDNDENFAQFIEFFIHVAEIHCFFIKVDGHHTLTFRYGFKCGKNRETVDVAIKIFQKNDKKYADIKIRYTENNHKLSYDTYHKVQELPSNTCKCYSI